MTQPNTATQEGTLELGQNGGGALRDAKRNYAIGPRDPIIPRDMVQRFRLRGGESLVVRCRPQQGAGAPTAMALETINGKSPAEYSQITPFEELTVVNPNQVLRFETPGGPMSTRIVDLVTPIGKGQRGLIVAPPRTGKTVLLKELALGIKANHPEIFLMMLLIDERPEEVTEMRRTLCAEGSGWQHGAPEVVYSSNDHDAKSHGRIAKLMIDKAKRHVEMGEDVLILMDSLTRLGRAFNNLVGSSGRTMTGGLDIRALEVPKQMFGAARKIEDGGSLTIVASVLIETGSRMDDFIFQEFKGTGNMELVLSRELANLRTWPALDLLQSGTRKEELLLGPETMEKMTRLRRRWVSMQPPKLMETILQDMGKFPSNEEFLRNLAT